MEDSLALAWIRECKWLDVERGDFTGALFCFMITAKFLGKWEE